MSEKPMVRILDVFPVEADGQRLICMRDPLKIGEQTMMINEVAFHFVTLMDGSFTVKELCDSFEARFGKRIMEEEINGFVKQLDEYYFLENDRYREKLEEEWDKYDALETRPCSHAGLSYPADPQELTTFMDKLYESGEARAAIEMSGKAAVKGIIAPHIDVRHGGECFVASYAYLKERNPDLFVVLGVGHGLSTNLYTVTPMDYETPLGRMKVDKQGIDSLRESLGDELFAEGFMHKAEHSIEFQVLFLQHILGDAARSIPILPVLCTSFHEIMERGISPMEIPDVAGFVEALNKAVGDRDVCYIAGVDLAHVGKKFGDPFVPDDSTAESIKIGDLHAMEFVGNADAEGFWKSISDGMNARKVCGVSAIYTFLKCRDFKKGHVLKYDQMRDEPSGSLVSYVSMVFE